MAKFSSARRGAFRMLLTVGSGSVYMGLHSVILDQYTFWRQRASYKGLDGKRIVGFSGDTPQIKPALQKLIDEVLEETVKLENRKIMWDVWFKTSPWFGGSTLLHTGARVLLPDYMNVNSAKDLNSHLINLVLEKEYNFTIDDPKQWLSEDGMAIIDSFILSPKAKKFLIARELYKAESFCVAIKAMLMTASLVLFFALKSFFFVRLPAVHSMDDKLRMIIVPLIMTFLSSAIANLMNELKNEQNGDSKAVTKGLKELGTISEDGDDDSVDSDYIEGGLEYYLKVIQRNKAIKSLIKGDSWWSWKARNINDDGTTKTRFFQMMYAPRVKETDRIRALEKWEHKDPQLKMFVT